MTAATQWQARVYHPAALAAIVEAELTAQGIPTDDLPAYLETQAAVMENPSEGAYILDARIDATGAYAEDHGLTVQQVVNAYLNAPALGITILAVSCDVEATMTAEQVRAAFESETIMSKLTDAELIATGDAGKIAERAESLSSGYTVRTHGKQAAGLYRQAAALYREQGQGYRATRCDGLAEWCESQQVAAVAR